MSRNGPGGPSDPVRLLVPVAGLAVLLVVGVLLQPALWIVWASPFLFVLCGALWVWGSIRAARESEMRASARRGQLEEACQMTRRGPR